MSRASGGLELQMTGDDARMVGAIDRAQERIRKLEQKIKDLNMLGPPKVTPPAPDTKQWEQIRVASADVAANVKNYVANLGIAAVGVAAIRKMFEDMRQDRVEAGQGYRGAGNAQAQLAQMAGGDPAMYQRMIGEVKKTRLETGASAEEATQLQFALENMGIADKRAMFAGFRKIVGDPGKFAEGVKTVQAAYGEEEAGSVEAVTNKLAAAAGLSKTTIEAFSPSASMSAQAMRGIGASDEEQLGTMGILSRSLKSASVASTQMQALSRTIEKRGLGGKGLIAGVEAIDKELAEMATKPLLSEPEQIEREQNRKMFERAKAKRAVGKELKPEELSAWKREDEFAAKEKESLDAKVLEYFGSSESMSAYRAIQVSKPDILSAIKFVDAAGKATGKGDWVSRTLALKEGDPQLKRILDADKAKQRKELEAEGAEGGKQIERETVFDTLKWQRQRDRQSGPRRWAEKQLDNLMDLYGMEPEEIRGRRPGERGNEWLAKGLARFLTGRMGDEAVIGADPNATGRRFGMSETYDPSKPPQSYNPANNLLTAIEGLLREQNATQKQLLAETKNASRGHNPTLAAPNQDEGGKGKS